MLENWKTSSCWKLKKLHFSISRISEAHEILVDRILALKKLSKNWDLLRSCYLCNIPGNLEVLYHPSSATLKKILAVFDLSLMVNIGVL